jgi:hypothetical protein
MGRGTEKSPYTRKDVLRRIKKHGGTAKGLDLSGKYFERGIDLSGLKLEEIILSDAILNYANFKGSRLWHVNFEGARLDYAHFEDTELYFARLSGAVLWFADFAVDTRLEHVDWGNYILGEEKNDHFAAAAITYRRLKIWHTEHGMYDIAGKFFYREMEARRKDQRWKSEPFKKLWSWTLKLLCGYGEKPERVAISTAVIVFGLALAYFLWGSFSSSSFADTLYYSVASFTALGYGQWAPQPTGWAKGMGAAEAVLGVSMLALFLVTFTRKMIR